MDFACSLPCIVMFVTALCELPLFKPKFSPNIIVGKPNLRQAKAQRYLVFVSFRDRTSIRNNTSCMTMKHNEKKHSFR